MPPGEARSSKAWSTCGDVHTSAFGEWTTFQNGSAIRRHPRVRYAGWVLRTVLLVDDEPDIRVIATVSLQMFGGLVVTTAASGREALELAPQLCPDVILLDVMMPEMDGPETLRRLRALEATAGTPVVFMTAKVLRDEIERWLALGAIGVISKPFDPTALPGELRALCERTP